MASNTVIKQNRGVHRLSSRIFADQIVFIRVEVKKSKGTLNESDVLRQLLDEAIKNRKNKAHGRN